MQLQGEGGGLMSDGGDTSPLEEEVWAIKITTKGEDFFAALYGFESIESLRAWAEEDLDRYEAFSRQVFAGSRAILAQEGLGDEDVVPESVFMMQWAYAQGVRHGIMAAEKPL